MEQSEVEWQYSACKNMDLNKFFPEPGRHYTVKVREAKAVCSGCPIKQDCLTYATEHEDYGIWGGKTPAERKRQGYPVPLPKDGIVRDPNNRLVNLVLANKQRSLQAIPEAIAKLQDALDKVQSGPEAFPEWIEAANLRINNPTMSLGELAAMSNQTKDSYAGKLRRLLAFANQPK